MITSGRRLECEKQKMYLYVVQGSHMKNFIFLMLVILSLPTFVLTQSENISKQTFTSEDKKRTYYLLVPQKIKATAPLLIVLHGSGHNGLLLVEKWKDLASREG